MMKKESIERVLLVQYAPGTRNRHASNRKIIERGTILSVLDFEKVIFKRKKEKKKKKLFFKINLRLQYHQFQMVEVAEKLEQPSQ